MGDILPFLPKKGRPYAADTPEDLRDEVSALIAERAELVEAIRPLVARAVVLGINVHPAALTLARDLASAIERPARRADLGGAA